MRVPAHKLPKGVNKFTPGAKHKKSTAAKTRKERKAEKEGGMAVEEESVVPELSAGEKEAAKAERKKANAHKSSWKKRTLHMTGRNGPRAINTMSNTPTHGF